MFHDHGRAVGQHFGHAGRDLVGVVAHADDRIGADFAGVLDQQAKGIGSCLLAQLRVDGDIAAEQRLHRGADVAHDAPRADHDPADQAEVPHNVATGQLERRGDEPWID